MTWLYVKTQSILETVSLYVKLLTAKEIGFYSIAGGAFTYMFGEWTGLLEILFIAIAADWITGVSASLKEGKGINSKANFWAA